MQAPARPYNVVRNVNIRLEQPAGDSTMQERAFATLLPSALATHNMDTY